MALPKAGVELVAEGLNGFVSDMGKANSAVSDFGRNGTQSAGAFNKGFSEVVIGGLRQVGAMAVTALAEAGRAVASFVGDSISLAGDFEAGMAEFRAVAGQDVDTAALEEFRDLFLEIGKKLPVSTSDVQDAAIELVKGGIEPATIAAGGLESSIKFAAAAMGGNLAGAAEISAKIVGGWAEVGATAADKATLLAHAQDVLTKAANASTVGVDDLSKGLFNVQGNAKLAGIGLDETVTALALISPNFSSAATAGTSLNAMIARLQPTTDPAAVAMMNLGLYTEETGSAFYDSQGNFVGWATASQMLQDATAGLTDAQKQSAFQTIFGMDAMGAAAELTRLGADGYNQMAESLDKANGVQENAAIKQEGFNTALDNAKGSVEALQIIIGSALLPVLTDLLNDVIAPAVNTFSDFAEAIFKAEDPMDALVAAVDDILPGFRDVVNIVKDVIGAFSSGGDAADTFGGVLQDLGGIWEKILSVADAVGKGYLAIANAILPVVTRFWQQHGDEIMAFLQSAYDQIIAIINTALDLYNAIVPPILHAIAGFIAEHGDTIVAALSGAWDIISGVIDAALAIIQGVLKTALALIQGDWEGAWTAIQEMAARVVEDILQVLDGAVELFRNSTQLALDAILGVWNSFADWAGIGDGIIDGIIEGIIGGVGALVDAVANAAQSALDAAKSLLGIESPSRAFAEQVGDPIIQGIIIGMEGALPGLFGVVDEIGMTLVSQTKKMTDEISKEIQKTVDDLKSQVERAQESIADLRVSGLTSTASINRQKLANLKALEELSDKGRAMAQAQLEQAQQQAAGIADPKQAAAFFKQRSAAIFELGKLTDEITAATDAGNFAERNRLIEQYQLINAAQLDEMEALLAQQAQGSETQQLTQLLQGLLSNGLLPGILDNSVIAGITNLLDQLRNTIRPPAGQGEMGGVLGGSTVSYSRTLNMPIYTNQSPGVISDSLAIANATLP